MFRFPSPSLSWRWVGRSGKKKGLTYDGVWVPVKAGLPSLLALHRTRWEHSPERRRLDFNSVLKLRLRFFNPIDSRAARNRPWWASAFLPLLTSIPFDQNWHHLYPTCAGGKHISNDAQIRVTSRMAPEIRTKLNAQKAEWKTQSKISCHFTWLLHRKNCPSRWLRSFLTASKPSRRSITAAKRKEKEKKERQKKHFKNRKA